MNRTINEATVKRYHYDSRDQLRQHLGDFVAAYSFERRLETLKGLTPHETICKAWQSETARFASNPQHQMPGSYTLGRTNLCPWMRHVVRQRSDCAG